MNLPDIYLDFMKPDVWDGLVLGSVIIGGALAVLRLMQDWSRYQRRKALHDSMGEQSEPRSDS